MYYCYILYSLKSKKLYFGYTNNLKKRYAEHNQGLSKSTKPFIPWQLVWYCGFLTIKKAKLFEKYLKTGSGKAFTYKRLIPEALKKDSLGGN